MLHAVYYDGRADARLRKVLLIQAADEASAVVLGDVSEGRPLAGQETAAERCPCHDAHAERSGSGNDILLVGSHPDIKITSRAEVGAARMTLQ